MKKLMAWLAVCVLLTAPALAEGEAAEWFAEASGGHSAVLEGGETVTAKHYTYSATIDGVSVRVCAICGQYDDGVLPVIPDAAAVSQKPKPSAQRGSFLVRGCANPFPAHPSVLFALTAVYEKDGGLATWKDVSTVSVPLKSVLPEGARLVRVSPASGDDSIQNPETWVDMEYSLEDGALTISTKTPALYLILGV